MTSWDESGWDDQPSRSAGGLNLAGDFNFYGALVPGMGSWLPPPAGLLAPASHQPSHPNGLIIFPFTAVGGMVQNQQC